jgi:hypothetical protein
MKSKANATPAKTPSKAFVKEMETMYPKGATITPKKVAAKPAAPAKKK